MSKRAVYYTTLRQKPEAEWDAFLMASSGLPGPRGNLELAQAAADCAGGEQIVRWMAFTPQRAPANTPEEFLYFCAVLCMGRLLAQGDPTWLATLRSAAGDPRWRAREAVAMALQRLGQADMPRMLAIALDWAGGSLLEARAAAAGVCEPVLLEDERHAAQVLEVLNRATALLAGSADRRSDAFRALRKGLGYCWSVALAAYPEKGRAVFESWLSSKDRDVRWMLFENLKKDRLLRRDPAWVEMCLKRLT
jgi:hypothetical protein